MVLIAVSKNKVDYPQFITISSKYRTKKNYSVYLILNCDRDNTKIIAEFVTSDEFTKIKQTDNVFKNVIKISKAEKQDMHRVFLPKRITEYMSWQKHLQLEMRETERGFELSP